ncbi:hypothetical protein HZC34_05335 [Candidatus Saganbacteria bacterium]|nr:hypothetical protein [Candidatus Saganbacteria bacterium]
MKIKFAALIFILLLCGGKSFCAEYPKIDVTGFKKWEYREVKVNPQTNYFLGLTHLGGYSPTVTGGPWQERLQLGIMGQLNEKLSVVYDVEQQPEAPDKYDVKVNYDNKHQLTFGDFTSTFTGNEFATTTKFLNGVMLSSKDTNYDFLAVPSAKLKSQIQGITSQRGNNSKGPYSLGHGSIVEGSESIQLNGAVIQRGTDYLIDYFEGKITFNRILTAADEFKYSFEFTNLIDIFFPSLSKKDFFGVQGRFTFDQATWGTKTPVLYPITKEWNEVFPAALESGSKISKYQSRQADQKTLLEIAFFREKLEKITDYMEKVTIALDIALKKKDWKKSKKLKLVLEKNRVRFDLIKNQVINLETGPEIGIMTGESQASIEAASISQLTEEASGRYKMKNLPVVPFSELAIFKGTQLKKNEDYTIRYEDGMLTLLTPILPDSLDQLKVSYKYFDTAPLVDSVPGTGARGPYKFSKEKIVINSEKIYVDKRFIVRDFDYTMDYDAGRVTFNYNISNTSIIDVNYRYQVFETPPPPPPPKYPKSLTIGMTYLKESSKKSVGEATASFIESKTGQSIIANDNTIYLSKFPVLTSAEGGSLVVTINGKAATAEIDYTVPTAEANALTGYANIIPKTKLPFINDRFDISNGFATGAIKMLSTLEATSEVTVLYSYKRSIVGRYSGAGNGSRGPYYIRNFRNIVPGTERIEVLNSGSLISIIYARNSSFEGDAGAKGYAINYSKDNPYITFNNELAPTQNFSIYFQYIAPQATVGGDISQDLTGIDAHARLGDLIQFEGDFARSNTDQVVASVTTTDAFTGFASPTNKITLKNLPVVENSEKVYVNTYLRNKDIDYFVDYTTGSLTFFYVTLTTSDVVSVDYAYQATGGSVVSSSVKSDSSYKYGVKSTLGKISASYNNKKIGFNFNPLGGTAIGVGSDYMDFSVGLAPTVQDFSTTYTYRETNNPIGASRTAYTRNYDRNYTAALNPLGLGNMNFAYRHLIVAGDPVSGSAVPSSDNSQNTFTAGVAPRALGFGPFALNQRYDAARTLSQDLLGKTKGNIKSGHANYTLQFTDRIKLGGDIQLSEPITINTMTGEVKTAHSLSRDYSYDASLDLTVPRIKKLSTYAKQLYHQAINFKPLPETKLTTKNTTYHVDFSPLDAISTNYDYNRQETPTVVVNGKNPKTERTVTGLSLTPNPAFSANYSRAEDFTVSEAALESSGLSNTYSSVWTPISHEKIKLGSNFQLFDRSARTPQGSIEVKTDTRSFVQDYTLAWTPLQILTFSPGFAQEEYYYLTSTTSAELKTRNQTVKCKINFKPIDRLGMDFNYNLKVTTSLNDNIDRHKSLVSVRTGCKVFTWGEIVHNLDDEHNQGEVQAGGVLPNIDYLKTTNTFSLNFNVPQENPVLNSLLLTAAYKLVKFENRVNPMDNLSAYLLTFEGTLNF